MSVPDNKLIAEVMMFAEVFKSAEVMVQRIVVLFLLSRKLHSMQQHYERRPRSLNPIWSFAGNNIRRGRNLSSDARPPRRCSCKLKLVP